jgi:hypothetical protein
MATPVPALAKLPSVTFEALQSLHLSPTANSSSDAALGFPQRSSVGARPTMSKKDHRRQRALLEFWLQRRRAPRLRRLVLSGVIVAAPDEAALSTQINGGSGGEESDKGALSFGGTAVSTTDEGYRTYPSEVSSVAAFDPEAPPAEAMRFMIAFSIDGSIAAEAAAATSAAASLGGPLGGPLRGPLGVLAASWGGQLLDLELWWCRGLDSDTLNRLAHQLPVLRRLVLEYSKVLASEDPVSGAWNSGRASEDARASPDGTSEEIPTGGVGSCSVGHASAVLSALAPLSALEVLNLAGTCDGPAVRTALHRARAAATAASAAAATAATATPASALAAVARHSSHGGSAKSMRRVRFGAPPATVRATAEAAADEEAARRRRSLAMPPRLHVVVVDSEAPCGAARWPLASALPLLENARAELAAASTEAVAVVALSRRERSALGEMSVERALAKIFES